MNAGPDGPVPAAVDVRDEESELIFSSFTEDDAWALGNDMRNAAHARRLPICIDIRRANGTELFHVSLAGATVDNDDWARRKAAVVFRFEESSARFGERFASAPAHPALAGWIDMNQLAPVGGSFPVRVAGAGIVAAVSASGLAGDGDHDFIVSAIRTFLERTTVLGPADGEGGHHYADPDAAVTSEGAARAY